MPTRKREWLAVVSELRARARAGDLASMEHLALILRDGIRDDQGRSIVRRDSRESFRLLRHAVSGGRVAAEHALADAYAGWFGTDTDMSQAIRLYRRAWRRGDAGAANSLGQVLYDLGEPSRALAWKKRAHSLRDGSAAVDIAYAYHYGIGTRENRARAAKMYGIARRSRFIGEFEREEAMYQLALLALDRRQRARAERLLALANRDDDYPEARCVLKRLEQGRHFVPCVCRRYRSRNRPEHAPCRRHPR